MPKVLSRSAQGYTHVYTLDVLNVVPDFFTGNFNAVAYTKGVTGQIDGTLPTAVSNGAYFVCTTPGVQGSKVYQLGHIYLGVAGVWVDQGVANGQRMVPTIDLTGGSVEFEADVEYTYVGYAYSAQPSTLVVNPNVPGVISTTSPYLKGKGKWSLQGVDIATTPTTYIEAPSSTMRYGVGNYRIESVRNAGNVAVAYTLASKAVLEQDPRLASWTVLSAGLTNGQVATIESPVTGFRFVFSDTTQGSAILQVN